MAPIKSQPTLNGPSVKPIELLETLVISFTVLRQIQKFFIVFLIAIVFQHGIDTTLRIDTNNVACFCRSIDSVDDFHNSRAVFNRAYTERFA